jgi:polysaccharide pyruvyl transferase WcaK-like protein
MRVLLTELGNHSSGDEAICIGAARRLRELGSQINCLYRVSLKESFQRAAIPAGHIAAPVNFPGPQISSVDELLRHAWTDFPEEMTTIESAVRESDLVCIAPGGKFSDGLRNHIKLIASSVAKQLNTPYIILHQSIGPISNPNECALIREVFTDAHLTGR